MEIQPTVTVGYIKQTKLDESNMMEVFRTIRKACLTRLVHMLNAQQARLVVVLYACNCFLNANAQDLWAF